ncbi:MalM family protein [Vibrio sp. HN007]|uniref:MalM family protein n=1 Tax=Vibrio iocasae TaxID=3098914 RepID=UPI0035D488B7
MFSLKNVLALSISALLIGCSSNSAQHTISAEESIALLNQTEVCCTAFGQVRYEEITQPGLYDYELMSESEALELSSGKSFVKGIQLPSSVVENIRVKVISAIGETVFVPNVMLLDSNFEPVTNYASHDIGYDSRSIFNGDVFEREITISNHQLAAGNAKYLLIYTTDDDLKESTVLPMLDQGTVRVGRQNEPRMFDDVIVQHSPLGQFQIRYSYETASNVNLAVVATPQIATTVAEPAETGLEVTPTVLETEVKKVENSTKVDGIQPETEAMFIELVEKAVRENQIDKALRFVEEGERAGSKKLRDVFFDALKRGQ